MHRLLLNHLKHVTGSRYAPWRSGPCASASTSFLNLRVSSTFSLCGSSFGTAAPTLLAVLSQLFCHTGLLRELFLPAVGYALVSWVLGSQPLAVLLMGSRVPIPGCFTFRHGHLAGVSFNQIQLFQCQLLLRNHCCCSIHGTSSILMSRAARTHRPLVTTEVAIFTHNSVDVQSLLHLLSRELHHIVSTTLSTSCPSSAEVTSRVSSCTRQSSVFKAKTRSSVPSAPLNRHYQCTHEFSRVSGHFTHCWAHRPVHRK